MKQYLISEKGCEECCFFKASSCTAKMPNTCYNLEERLGIKNISFTEIKNPEKEYLGQ